MSEETNTYKTKAQQAKEARHARVCNLFKEYTEKYGQFSPTRRAAVIAKQEEQYPDGITTVMGVIKILRMYDLWQPRPYKR